MERQKGTSRPNGYSFGLGLDAGHRRVHHAPMTHDASEYDETHVDHNVIYVPQHDAHVCTTCWCWIEPQCDDPDCKFCPDRPRLPGREGKWSY
jgi:hypothetical protein